MDNKLIIIAEAGVNHNGELAIAKELIAAAAEARADYVKFQAFKADRLVSQHAPKAAYQQRATNDEGNQWEMLRALELTDAEIGILWQYAREQHIGILASPFDIESVRSLMKYDMPIIKIPSGEITNLPYLQYISTVGKPVILSTGMAEMSEVRRAVDILLSTGMDKEHITVLHCHTEYPTSFQDVNLNAMVSMQKELEVKVGYSDHTEGMEIPIAAAALGACVIEKHFTLDRSMDGPDHQSSLEPDELKQMVTALRHVRQALGDGVKKPTETELKNKAVVRKSIHYGRKLDRGHLLEEKDLVMLRPGDGLSPMELPGVLGRALASSVEKGQQLKESDLL